MPVRRHRRCGRMSCCMNLRRPCINSLPRYCMPRPLFQSHPNQHASSSSQSDCSCGEENFCTVENCRNAPMCISSQPLYCPYGSYNTDANLPTSSTPQHGTDPVANYPHLTDRVPSPSPFYQNMPSRFPPDYGRAERNYQNGWVYEREEPDAPFRNFQDSFPRFSPLRLSSPQLMTSSPASRNAGRFEPQLSSVHRTQQPSTPHSRPRADNLPPHTHLTAETISGECEGNTRQNVINFDQSHDQRDGGILFKDDFYKRVQCIKQNDGKCGIESSCSKNHATHHNPHTCDGTGGRLLPNGQPTTDSHQNPPHQEATDQPVNCPGHVLRTMGSQTPLCPSMQRGTPCDTPDHCPSAINDIAKSKCQCRYPPSLKHLSCSGNISGSCNCDQK